MFFKLFLIKNCDIYGVITLCGFCIIVGLRAYAYKGGLARSGILLSARRVINFALSYDVNGNANNLLRKDYKRRKLKTKKYLNSALGCETYDSRLDVFIAYVGLDLGLFISSYGFVSIGRYAQRRMT